MENIKRNAKGFKVTMGNSDEYMIKHIPGIRESLMTTQKENGTFSFKERVELETVDNIQLLFLPFRKVSFIPDIQRIEEHFDENKTLLVFGHCPPYENHEKEYYIMHDEALEYISSRIQIKFYYFHGHIHSDKTYKYSVPNIPNLTIITPKAPDTEQGINWNHDYIEVDTDTAEMNVYSIDSGDEVGVLDLPVGYREKEDHWNDFVLGK